MASPSLTYTLTNGTTADASQVQQNFTDLLNGYTDGTKDLSISALTCAGTATLNGHVNLGNSSADDLTVTASLASTLPIKTTNSYDIGSSTLGLRALYLGANSQTVNIKGSGSMSATWTLTLPVTAGSANYCLETNGSGVTSWVNRVSRYETKVLSGDVNSDADLISFSSLTAGKTYRLSGVVMGTFTTTGFFRVYITEGSTDVRVLHFSNVVATGHQISVGFSRVFTATETTVKLRSANIGGTEIIDAEDSSMPATWATLEELLDTEITTAF